MRLGRQTLKSLPIVERQTIIYDDDLPGFGLRLMPPSNRNFEGSRSWIVEYRPGNGGRGTPKRRITIGKIEVISPDEARRSARDLLAKARLGDDPAKARQDDRSAPTVADLKDQYLKETQPARKARSREFYESCWNRHIIPQIGHLKAKDVTAGDLVSAHSAIGKKSPIMANRMLALSSHFFNWCEQKRIRARNSNPVGELGAKSRFRETKRTRYLSNDEYAALGVAIAKAEEEGVAWTARADGASKHAPKSSEARTVKIDADVADCLRLLLLTGARLREILHLKWTEVDWERSALCLQDSKTGAKTILLNSAAVAVLDRLKSNKVKNQVYVVKGDALDKPRSGLKRPWALVRRLAGLDDLRIHDLRHSFASVSVSGGISLPLIGGLLGHSSTATTQRYAHLANDPLRQANEDVGVRISELLGASL